MGLGALHTRSLKEAREEAKRLRQLLLDGTDPLEHRKKDTESRAVASAKNKTFAEVAAAYLSAHRNDWKNPRHVSAMGKQPHQGRQGDRQPAGRRHRHIACAGGPGADLAQEAGNRQPHPQAHRKSTGLRHRCKIPQA